MPVTHVASARTPGTYPGVSSNTDTITISKPSGTVDGDVMVAWTVIGATHTLTQPGGWTLLDSFDTGTGGFRMLVWYKIAASEGSNYTWTSSSNTVPATGIISTFRGVDTVSGPIHAYDKTGSVASTNPVTTPTVSTTQYARMVHSIFYRCTGVVQGTITDPAGYTQLNGTANRGGAIQFYGDAWMANSVVAPGSQTGVAGTGSQGTIEANLRFSIALLEVLPTTDAPATKADITATAYNAASLTISTTATFGAVTATAYDATSLTGMAAENVPQAAAVATAHNAAGWVIHPVDAGAVAFDATVAVSTVSEFASATASALNSVGYFGSPRERRYSIPAEDRTLRARRGKSDRG